MAETVIVSAARTPFGKLGGGLAPLSATDLGGIAIAEAVKRAGIPADHIDNVIMGMVLQGGAGQIPSRQATNKAGLPWETPSETINKVCASGLRAVTMADQQIRSGDASIIVAGGMESMSNAPYFLKKARWGYRMGHDELIDLMVHDGLWCAFHNRHMAVHGSVVAAEYGISRAEQDEWALRSHNLAIKAIDSGIMAQEIIPVTIPQKKGDPKVIITDEGPRRDTSLEQLAKLPPVFDKNGTVTAGNAPGVNDGAGAMVLMSSDKAKELGVQPLAKIIGHAFVALEAQYIATAPGHAVNKLLQKNNLKISDINLLEINEAFAAVPLVSQKIANWNPELVNVNGGAVALGHPIGASGARIIMTLIYELRRRGGGYGIAAICSGAAQGDAVLIKVD
ncbi:acetyl-CoA C-acetyltransferase [Carboxydocella sporoproducens DSM 16521]|uniref:Acetyl-CoA acetyltransferase n=2 Tax=Carboxydocella TaxID=178898 RepID=A0A1T4LTP5_9FIRM|nr:MULTISPECIES: acetyl-CoA C-acetyltransferase [Carboxydocella]AVX20607.1 acetyl-CoA C-acetyltransferase [Carboxydocella thermautotrophica]AVX31029.1 acetyl-CoA C-acetyltransferase [Carboxydocella thermautotrophica]SJZ58083.1 acetyl-CoA C-acetyltransferase [Carboxydocella sporoproducens DSM 16521]